MVGRPAGGTIAAPRRAWIPDRRAAYVLVILAACCWRRPSRSSAPARSVATVIPPVNGAIAYMRGDETKDKAQLYVACPDLTNERPIDARGGEEQRLARLVPDGSRLAFNANFDDPDPTDDVDIWDIYTTTADGTDLRKLTARQASRGTRPTQPMGP